MLSCRIIPSWFFRSASVVPLHTWNLQYSWKFCKDLVILPFTTSSADLTRFLGDLSGPWCFISFFKVLWKSMIKLLVFSYQVILGLLWTFFKYLFSSSWVSFRLYLSTLFDLKVNLYFSFYCLSFRKRCLQF